MEVRHSILKLGISALSPEIYVNCVENGKIAISIVMVLFRSPDRRKKKNSTVSTGTSFHLVQHGIFEEPARSVLNTVLFVQYTMRNAANFALSEIFRLLYPSK